MREDQFDGYVEEVRGLQDEFRGRIAVRLGLEADYAEGHEELARWLSRADWDLVLGSVHWVAGGWIDDPGRSPARFEREGVEDLYDEYYRLLAKAARTGLFDVLTHFDLPKKHGHRPAAAPGKGRGRRDRGGAGGRLRRRDLLGGAAQARRRGVPRAAAARPPRRGGRPGDVLLRRARPGGSRVGLRADAAARAGMRSRRVRHVREAAESPPPAAPVNCRPSSAKRSAEGRRRRAKVA